MFDCVSANAPSTPRNLHELEDVQIFSCVPKCDRFLAWDANHQPFSQRGRPAPSTKVAPESGRPFRNFKRPSGQFMVNGNVVPVTGHLPSLPNLGTGVYRIAFKRRFYGGFGLCLSFVIDGIV